MMLKDMPVGAMGWLYQTPYLKTEDSKYSARLSEVVCLSDNYSTLMLVSANLKSATVMKNIIKETFYEEA